MSNLYYTAIEKSPGTYAWQTKNISDLMIEFAITKERIFIAKKDSRMKLNKKGFYYTENYKG